MKTDMSKLSRQHLQRHIRFSPDKSMRAEASRRLGELNRPTHRPAVVTHRPAVTTSPADLRGMSIEALMLSVIGDPRNSPEDQLRASRGLAEYYRAQEANERQIAARAANERRMLSALREDCRPQGSKPCAVRVTLADGTSVMRHEFR